MKLLSSVLASCMSFPGDSRSAYYAGGNPPPQLMQGQPRSMQGLQQGMSMPPLYAGNQVSTRKRFRNCASACNLLHQGVPIPPYAVPPAALGVARGMPMGMPQQAMSLQQVRCM